MLLGFDTDGGTNFGLAIQQAQAVVREQSWSTERFPVIIFLSDGECSIGDVMQDLCRTAIRLGNAVSYHTVSFGPDGPSMYLRRMAEMARDAQNNAPRDPLVPATVSCIWEKVAVKFVQVQQVHTLVLLLQLVLCWPKFHPCPSLRLTCICLPIADHQSV
ncbi:hypothetical protein L210DRAFT_2345002 [Boletus edulis BED1]|uniref:VWFA domain-containing protein n=1 Tax=Boletus edulis BED1 TaxID=1328754 RepID=A0AAD4G6L6_BOLED|nr:hypothetical protein L210DRAFT_2345002 [Boletus edulis BED1]